MSIKKEIQLQITIPMNEMPSVPEMSETSKDHCLQISNFQCNYNSLAAGRGISHLVTTTGNGS